MNTDPEFDQIAQTWLQDGPTEMPDRSLQAALDEVHVTSQQRFGAARRTFPVNGNAFRLAVAAVVGLLIIVVGGIYLGSSRSGGVAGRPATTDSSPTPSATPIPSATPRPTSTPSPSSVPSPSPTPIDTTSWVSISSGRYAFDVAYPPTWSARPATRDWSLDVDRGKEVSPGTDEFNGGPTGSDISLTAFSAPVPAGTSNEDWIAAYIAPGSSPSCTATDQWEAITVDGRPAKLNPDACDASQAYVFIGDRAYVFSVWRPYQVPLLKAFISTVRFHPDALPTATPSPSASPSPTS